MADYHQVYVSASELCKSTYITEDSKMGKQPALFTLHGNTEKDKELTEWEHIETDRHGNTTIRTVNSFAAKGVFFSQEKFGGMSVAADPPIRVYKDDSTKEEMKHRNEVIKQLDMDGVKDYVVM